MGIQSHAASGNGKIDTAVLWRHLATSNKIQNIDTLMTRVKIEDIMFSERR